MQLMDLQLPGNVVPEWLMWLPRKSESLSISAKWEGAFSSYSKQEESWCLPTPPHKQNSGSTERGSWSSTPWQQAFWVVFVFPLFSSFSFHLFTDRQQAFCRIFWTTAKCFVERFWTEDYFEWVHGQRLRLCNAGPKTRSMFSRWRCLSWGING